MAWDIDILQPNISCVPVFMKMHYCYSASIQSATIGSQEKRHSNGVSLVGR